ncbi:MraY family glycosyltransferase [Legionella worsleiensis]|uniref:Alpha-N-acetylglucosaminyltransferase n=1 Tax=Legionella worsleiensis TaxID=45076 RepID=A0A0W1A3L2_9GAMM|nr:glycosyltransferase family 4 protein [Legionella worsleiensis]KTD75864.1 alpha-N-acetylglucosaminyltransferase [Legionella worsleiensis]STY32877.1 alpha-N-acetylglucosaminyltransferase [Legionella worsleiensis]
MIIILSSIFLLSYACTRLFCTLAQNSKLIDRPNDRTLHLEPTVRGGGVVFIALALLSIPFLCYINATSFGDWAGLLIGVILIAVISFLDDLYHLSVTVRFAVQCVVALIVSLFLRPEHLDFIFFSISNGYVISVFIFFVVIWAINHFNFMDGLDGFCALQAIFLLACYATFFYCYQAAVYQDFCFILMMGLFAFLVFNFPPAKLFMGDVGSASLGLIIFSLALLGQQKYQIPIGYWFVLNGLFLFDSTITLLRRIANKEQWFAPHRKHAYQRLKQYGMDTRFILLGQLIINSIAGFLVFYTLNHLINSVVVVGAVLFLLIAVYCAVEKIYPMNQRS